MNILLEARSLGATGGGVATYTRELIANLLSLYPNDSYEILYGKSGAVGTFSGAQETVLPLVSDALLPFWMQRAKSYAQSRWMNVLHFTKAAIPKPPAGIPVVVTMYDIIPILLPESQSPLRRLYWPSVLSYAATHASHIMTISERSKQDIIERYGIAESRITVTPLAVDTSHFRPQPSRGGTSAGKYILFVGTKDRRKNISSLIRAFAAIAGKIPHKLVIVGKKAHKQDDSLQTALQFHVQDRVDFREDVSYEALPALYAGADMFVWPSVYEGWGFPPQEAMACGTPVIVSDGGPLPEVVGDAGIIVPFSTANLHERMNDEAFIERLSAEMLSLLSDEAKQKELSQRGLERVKRFSWKDVARKTHEVYERLAV